jgi:hypothetical protein
MAQLISIQKRLADVVVQALLVVLKVLAHTGNDNFVAVITDICILAVSFLANIFINFADLQTGDR